MKKLVERVLKEADVSLNGRGPSDVQILDNRFYSEVLKKGSLGAGESYMLARWECERLDDLFYKICSSGLSDQFTSKNPLIAMLSRFFLNIQNRKSSKKVIDKHYNLGNDLYKAMLGESMAYTCGYWKGANTLDQAQNNKYDLVCKKVDLKKGERVLDLGCGFGGFAKFAALNYGCEVVAVNISEEQVRFAQENCKGLPISFFLCDYRDDVQYNPQGALFDKVISIGLCEHIGFKNYQTFMKIAERNMKKEGLFLLHTIGKNITLDALEPWTHKYIFPNGVLPSIAALSKASEKIFVIEDLHNFGADYDRTLIAWYENFAQNWDQIKGQYDETFRRMWRYYLLTCAGAFRARTMQLWQIVLSKKGVHGGYKSIR